MLKHAGRPGALRTLSNVHPGPGGICDAYTRGASELEGKRQEGSRERHGRELASAYSFGSRFEAENGTNPEELLAAAHAACFAMALSLELGKAGYEPERIDAEARVTIEPADGGFAIRSSHIVCEARVPRIDEVSFSKFADATKLGCPVSKALSGVEITLDARLAR